MFYVSSIVDLDKKIGITDTRDGVEEFYTDSQIYDFMTKGIVDIYGTSPFNHRANCTVLEIDKTITISRLNNLLSEWGRIHNQWHGHPVEDYLASAKIGTKITVNYTYVGDGGRRSHRGITRLTKLNYDEWYYDDTDNISSGENGDNRFAAHCLEVACLYSRSYNIGITQVK